MRIAAHFTGLSLVLATIVVPCRTSFAEDAKRDHETEVPSLDGLLATALNHHPDIRAAEAEMERCRLRVAKEIMSFRQEWVSEMAALVGARSEANNAEQDLERLKSLSDAVSGTKLLESERLVRAARERMAVSDERLREMRLMLPYLLGAAATEEAQQGRGEPGNSPDSSPSFERLLRERLEVLNRVAELQQEAYKSGEIGFEDVSSAQVEAALARLELANTADERRRLRKEMIAITKQIEGITIQLFRANEATQVDVLKAKAFRLHAEADLVREQQS